MTGATSRVRASAMKVGPPPVRAHLASLFLRPRTPPLWLGVVVATSLIVVESLLVYLLKQVDPATACGIVYLVGVLLVSVTWGFGLAAVTSLASRHCLRLLPHGGRRELHPDRRSGRGGSRCLPGRRAVGQQPREPGPIARSRGGPTPPGGRGKP
jgi:hypothetical protein